MDYVFSAEALAYYVSYSVCPDCDEFVPEDSILIEFEKHSGVIAGAHQLYACPCGAQWSLFNTEGGAQ